MDSDALKTFLAVHRAKGFSSAAERLHRSQPAISRRMALLEAELGAPLFERVAGGVVLSQAGRVLLPHAERVLAALKDAELALAATRSQNAGPVSLAVVGTLANAELTEALKTFAAQCPNAELSLRTAASNEVSELVRRGAADIGLRYFEDPAGDLDCAALAPERLTVACAREHKHAGRDVASLRALGGERWLGFPLQANSAQSHIHAQFLVRGVSDFRFVPVDSLTAQKRLVEAGLGLALLPESSIREELAARRLATIAVRDLKAVNPVFAVTRRGGYLNTASQRLIEILKADWTPSRARRGKR